MTFEICNDLIFGKWCFVSVFEFRMVSKVYSTDLMRKKKIQLCKKFGMVKFEKSETRKFCSTLLHVLSELNMLTAYVSMQ